MKNKTIDKHFKLVELIEATYKQRENPESLHLCIKYCREQIKLFPEFREAYWDEQIAANEDMSEYWETLKAENRIDIRIPSFQRLAKILEEQGDIAGAIHVCKLAVSSNLTDGTKGGFEGRKERLLRKLGVKK
jgi:hypothetical protein